MASVGSLALTTSEYVLHTPQVLRSRSDGTYPTRTLLSELVRKLSWKHSSTFPNFCLVTSMWDADLAVFLSRGLLEGVYE